MRHLRYVTAKARSTAVSHMLQWLLRVCCTTALVDLSWHPPLHANEASLRTVIESSVWYLGNTLSHNLNVAPPAVHIAFRGEILPAGCVSRPSDYTVYGSHYCGKTRTIVLELAQLENIRIKYGDAGVAFAIAHEYAHFMQDYASVRVADPFFELHADCMAASILLGGNNHAIQRLGIDQNDILEMLRTAYAVGGGSVHGTSEQRVNAFLHGARNSLLDCDNYAGVRRDATGGVGVPPERPSKEVAELPFGWIERYYFKGNPQGEISLSAPMLLSLGKTEYGVDMRLKYHNLYIENLFGDINKIKFIVDIGGITTKAEYSCELNKYARHPETVSNYHLRPSEAKDAPLEMFRAFQGICRGLILGG